MFIRIFYILIIIAFYHNAFALGDCSKPLEPECVGNEDTYKSKEAYESCTTEFQAMSAKTKEYIGCMKNELKKTADEVQNKADEAIDEVNSSMKKFNCRANPQAIC